MKRISKIIIIIIITISGQVFSQTRMMELDTILEKNDPKLLNLNQHQIFIDTTRNSTFFNKLKNWKRTKYNINDIEVYLKQLNKKFKSKSITLKEFPNNFIKLRKLKGKFVLYDRCDGIDQRFELQKNSFIVYGPLEVECYTISKIIISEKENIKLELNGIISNSQFKKSILEIQKINELIYKMSLKSNGRNFNTFLTTINEISNFNLIVNHCPKMKVSEFKRFDGMKKTKLIEIE